MSHFSNFVRATFLSLCFGTLPTHAQNANITFISQREPNTSSSIYYGDVWGEGDIACLGIWRGFAAPYGVGIYDISNPASPILRSTYISAISSADNQFELGVVRNKIGYFGSWSGGGVHIVSLTNMAAPLFLSRIGSVGGGFDSVHTVFLERNFLYEAAHVAGINSVKVIDISDPFAPFFVRDIVSTNAYKVHQITAVKRGTNTILYTSDFGNGGSSPGETDFWDVSNVGAQPAQWLGKIISGGSSHSSWPTPDGNTLVVCRETEGGDVRLYDISNPAVPSLQCIISPATMGREAAIPHNPVVVSNLLFLSWYQNGIQIFDISDRARPVRIGAYDTFAGAKTESFQGNWGVFPNLGLDKLLLSDIQSGFYILNATGILTGTNNYLPLLVVQPVSTTVSNGTTVTLSAEVTGSSIKYQWRFNGVALSGATNSDLVFNSVRATNSGNYFVIATNSFGSVTSAVASLSVTVPQGSSPTITAQPTNTSVYAGSPVTFAVAVIGAAPLNFQWRFNGTDLLNATNSSLALSQVQGEKVGNYSVVVFNDYGTTTSSNAFLSIIDSPYLNNVRATPGGRSALISWNSTIPSDSLVQFSIADTIIAGAASAAAQGASFTSSSYIDRKIRTNHTILLTGLAPATRYSFQVISSTESNSFPSGVYQFVTAGAPIILDDTNSAVTFTGTWTTSVNVAGFYGTNYRYANVSSSTLRMATFTPNIPVAGKYDVYEWHTAATDRAVNAPFAISYNGGSNNFLVNQQINGGRWNLLATNLPFSEGTTGFVRLSNNAGNSVVIADAVQFIYVDAQETPIDNSVPAWWENFYFGGHVNPLADPDGDSFTTAAEYILGTSPIDPNSKFTLDLQAAGSAANITFWPFLGNRNYQLLYRSNVVDSAWQTMSPGSINSTPYGHGIFTLPISNASQGFYRLAVQLTTNGIFAGKFVLSKGASNSGFSEAACGVNRIYVK